MGSNFEETLIKIVSVTGLSVIRQEDLVMLFVAGILIYLAIAKKFEPLLLLPIGFGCMLANLPLSHLTSVDEGGLFYFFYFGVKIIILRLFRQLIKLQS